jgi:hypothetical protein
MPRSASFFSTVPAIAVLPSGAAAPKNAVFVFADHGSAGKRHRRGGGVAAAACGPYLAKRRQRMWSTGELR